MLIIGGFVTLGWLIAGITTVAKNRKRIPPSLWVLAVPFWPFTLVILGLLPEKNEGGAA